MESKYLLENETIISQSKNASIVLTNIRVLHTIKGTGNINVHSIFLEKISATQIQYKSYPILLLLLVFCGCAGIYFIVEKGMEMAQLGFGAAGLFFLTYFLTLKRVMLITSDGGTKISFQTRGMRKEAISNFIHDIEKAQNDRFNKTRISLKKNS
ncbi:MAG: hypothetical protein GQ574_27265 [Crocinitomix sp.]|nr:hypothetical protein [Crocinitomix sp.]